MSWFIVLDRQVFLYSFIAIKSYKTLCSIFLLFYLIVYVYYIVKYESVKVFQKSIDEIKDKRGLYLFLHMSEGKKASNDEVFSQALYLSLLANRLEAMDRFYYQLDDCLVDSKHIEGFFYPKIIKAIVCDENVDKQTRDSFFDIKNKRSLITKQLPRAIRHSWWESAYPIFIDVAYNEDKNETLELLLENIFELNKISLPIQRKFASDFKRYGNSWGDGNSAILYDNPLVFVSIQTIKSALAKGDFATVKRLCEFNATFGGPVLSNYETDMARVNLNTKLSDFEKKKLSVIHDGIVNVKELLELRDFDSYIEMINLPCNLRELYLKLLEEKKYRDLFRFSFENKHSEIYNKLLPSKIDIEGLRQAILAKTGTGNKKEVYQSNEKKYILRFKDIMGFEDIRFYETAIKYDPSKLDFALESIIKEFPERFDIQKLLLDNGAKLHKRWVEDVGDEDLVSRDEIDEVGTQMLKNQIDILKKKEK